MEIRTERLVLRPVERSDAEEVLAYSNDESITMMLFYPMRTMEEVRDYLERSAADWESPVPYWREFAVLRDGKIIGGMDLIFTDGGKSAELGWVLKKDCRGQGYATESALALKAYAYAAGAEKITAECDTRNAASQSVMKKLGMHLAAERERVYPKTGEHAREYIYEIGKEEENE